MATGISSATSTHACNWCKCSKEDRGDTSREWALDDPADGNSHTIEENLAISKLPKTEKMKCHQLTTIPGHSLEKSSSEHTAFVSACLRCARRLPFVARLDERVQNHGQDENDIRCCKSGQSIFILHLITLIPNAYATIQYINTQMYIWCLSNSLPCMP